MTQRIQANTVRPGMVIRQNYGGKHSYRSEDSLVTHVSFTGQEFDIRMAHLKEISEVPKVTITMVPLSWFPLDSQSPKGFVIVSRWIDTVDYVTERGEIWKS